MTEILSKTRDPESPWVEKLVKAIESGGEWTE